MNFDHAIAREFHRKTPFEVADEIKRLIAEQPKVSFEQLEAGQVVYYKSSYGDRDQVLRVVKTTPKRKLADVEQIDGAYAFRAAAGSYHGSFSVLNEELISFVGLKEHRHVIDEALKRGLEIPARVRVRYADLFIEQPSRFRAKRLTEFMTPTWGKAITADAIDQMIAEKHDRIRKLEEERVKSLVLNPSHSQDYDKYIADAIADTDFYRWVKPHVEVGGVFYLNGEKP